MAFHRRDVKKNEDMPSADKSSFLFAKNRANGAWGEAKTPKRCVRSDDFQFDAPPHGILCRGTVLLCIDREIFTVFKAMVTQ